jgi:DNA-directed RNA polymerase specialized sigma24 family protein
VAGWEGTIVRASSPASDDDFTAWLGRESDGLARFALFVTGNRDDAQDVLQDVLAAIQPRYDRLASAGETGAYARRAISNAAVSRWRKGRRYVLLADVEITRQDPADQLATLGTVDSVVMCQHTKGTGATLLASSVISGQKITDLAAALRAAPAEGPRCGLYYLGTDVRVLRLGTSAGVREVFVYPNGCNENYLTGGTSRRELTSAVCQALALPPGTNGGCTKS